MIVAVAGVLSTLMALDDAMLRVILALPLVLVLPGYALAAAIFPKQRLGAPERLLFSVGLSLAVAVLGGLVLNMTPWGLFSGSWAVLLGAITLGASIVALVRWREPLLVAVGQSRTGLRAYEVLLISLAALVAVAGLRLVRTPVSPQGFQGYTVLSILPADENARDAVRLGVSSNEFAATSYRLQVKLNDTILREWPAIALAPGEQWETTVVLPTAQAQDERVEALLYRSDAPDMVYRRGLLWRGQASK
jgi:uncharacterized membrane protein